MSEAIKPTPGVWKWDSDPIKGDPLGRVRYRVVTTGKTITQCYYSSSDEYAKDDARLIAEAGTVFHETGLSPRQLAERNAELLEVARALVAYDEAEHEDHVLLMLDYADMLKAARAALAKCQPKPQEGHT